MGKKIDELSADVLDAVRQQLGAPSGADTRFDARIEEMGADDLFERYCKWHGLIGYSYDLKRALHSIEAACGERKTR